MMQGVDFSTFFIFIYFARRWVDRAARAWVVSANLRA